MRKEKILFFEDLKETVPNLNRSTLSRWIKAGKFPKPKKIGSRRIAWLSTEVFAWLDSLKGDTK